MSNVEKISARMSERERRDARDRILAREVGIEIGRRREARRQAEARQSARARAAVIGFLVGAFLVASWFVGAQRAYGAERVEAKYKTSGASAKYPLPKHWRVYVKVARCEQPAIASRPSRIAKQYWMGVRWDHPGMGNGRGWPGGLGMMHVHWKQFKPRGAPRLQEDATPAQQLISAHRAYVHFKRIYGTRGGTTFWVCSKQIGWRGIEKGRVVWG